MINLLKVIPVFHISINKYPTVLLQIKRNDGKKLLEL